MYKKKAKNTHLTSHKRKQIKTKVEDIISYSLCVFVFVLQLHYSFTFHHFIIDVTSSKNDQ